MHDVIIIGAGPAGLSAARWCDELGLDTLVLEQNEEVGGQLLSVYNSIEDYLGVRAENGPELRDLFVEQTRISDFDLWTNVEIESVDLKAKRVAEFPARLNSKHTASSNPRRAIGNSLPAKMFASLAAAMPQRRMLCCSRKFVQR